jgi:phosphatidylserine/phosphatidylglycerophosphate/cardiolipin synthase-like enzyme
MMIPSDIFDSGEIAAPLLDLVNNERDAINIAMYQVNSASAFNRAGLHTIYAALRAAPSSCPQCRILLAQPRKDSEPTLFNRRAAAELTDAGWQVRTAPASRLMHAKLILFGHHTAILGSHNISANAVTRNLEISIRLTQPDILARLHSVFWNWWSLGSSRSSDHGKSERPDDPA